MSEPETVGTMTSTLYRFAADLRAAGYYVHPSIPDDALVRVTLRVDGDVAYHTTEVQLAGYVDAVTVRVKVA